MALNLHDSYYDEQPGLHLTVKENEDGTATVTAPGGIRFDGKSTEEALRAARLDMERGALKSKLMAEERRPKWKDDPFWRK